MVRYSPYAAVCCVLDAFVVRLVRCSPFQQLEVILIIVRLLAQVFRVQGRLLSESRCGYFRAAMHSGSGGAGDRDRSQRVRNHRGGRSLWSRVARLPGWATALYNRFRAISSTAELRSVVAALRELLALCEELLHSLEESDRRARAANNQP